LNIAAHAVREFDVDLHEPHNDSTTITFHGDYESAERERTLRGRLRPDAETLEELRIVLG
jgi:hypothetical protein